MRKQGFYAITGASIVVTAISLGFLAAKLSSARSYVPPAPGSARQRAAAGATSAPEAPPERWTNIFAPAQGMAIPSKVAQAPGAASAPKTTYVLLGTITSETPSARRAILWAEGLKEPRLFREKAEIEPGVTVAAIARDHVMLAAGKQKERLDLLPVGSRTRVPAGKGPAGPAPPSGAETRIDAPGAAGGPTAPLRVSQIRNNVFAVDAASVNQLTTNLNQFMTQVRIVPYFEGEKSAGYRLASIRPGTAFEQLGFRAGDVIQQVNNLEVSSPDKLYTIFQNLKDEKRVTVNVLRQGAKDTLTYEIR